ncbi:RNI-like protein [Dioscorea alata]|uniref:RNI-like protein n=2 Tax=Dioscorea alata TaxID=55571 RepID=A0ACB7U763_DIOAL|nr:RNI-like protein [Dioscorea alata]
MEMERRWEDMDMDCLVSIFQRLGLDDMVLSVPFVCKSWHKASLDPHCWKVLNFSTLDFIPLSHFAHRFTSLYSLKSFSVFNFMKLVLHRSAGFAVELFFPPWLDAPLAQLTSFFNECSRLKIIVLPRLLSQDEMMIPEFIGGFKELEYLEMQCKPGCFLELVKEINLKCRNLVGISMAGYVKHEDALAMVNLIPKLKYLNMSKSYMEKESLMVIVNGCRYLERLEVKGCFALEVDDEILRRASYIKTFKYEGCRTAQEYFDDSEDDDDFTSSW